MVIIHKIFYIYGKIIVLILTNWQQNIKNLISIARAILLCINESMFSTSIYVLAKCGTPTTTYIFVVGSQRVKFVRMVSKFRIFSEQEVKNQKKLAKSLKIFSRTASATGEQKTVL
jgi:hypothetical protein